MELLEGGRRGAEATQPRREHLGLPPPCPLCAPFPPRTGAELGCGAPRRVWGPHLPLDRTKSGHKLLITCFSPPHSVLKPLHPLPFPRQSAPGQLRVALIAALLRVSLLAALKDHEELIFLLFFLPVKHSERLIFKFCFPLKHPIFLPARFRSSDKQDHPARVINIPDPIRALRGGFVVSWLPSGCAGRIINTTASSAGR